MPAAPAVRARPDRVPFRCVECGWSTTKWVGRCGECQAWGTVEQVGAGARSGAVRTAAAVLTGAAAVPITSVDAAQAHALPTGVGELDRVLGGGLVPGAVVLLAGEPGVGKSTLLLDVAARWAAAGRRSLYVTGEESATQVRLRADRTATVADDLYLAADTDLGTVLGHLEAVAPTLVILDSVQTVASAEVDGAAGGVTQVREVAAAMSQAAKTRGIATILVGHVTKDGGIAGPRVLEHLVDVVLQFEGDRQSSLRLVRAVKNRFGPADEVGCFELRDGGIEGLADPSGLFLSRHAQPVPGTCVTVTVEGRRPLPVEVQALVAASPLATPRRATSGLDASRVAMILAVLERRGGVRLGPSDVYAATVGGVRLVDPAADLALAMAVASAAQDRAVAPGLVVLGEVGLAGEVRRVPDLTRRLAEAERLGFTRAIVPAGCDPSGGRLTIAAVADVQAALAAALGPAHLH